jgi:hypothetical protein
MGLRRELMELKEFKRQHSERISALEVEIKKLKNPPKYKKTETVNVKVGKEVKKGKVADIVYSYNESFGRCTSRGTWLYDIFIDGYGLKKCVREADIVK